MKETEFQSFINKHFNYLINDYSFEQTIYDWERASHNFERLIFVSGSHHVKFTKERVQVFMDINFVQAMQFADENDEWFDFQIIMNYIKFMQEYDTINEELVNQQFGDRNTRFQENINRINTLPSIEDQVKNLATKFQENITNIFTGIDFHDLFKYREMWNHQRWT